MSGDQQFIIALIGAFGVLIGAIGGLYAQIRSLHKDVNGRLTELLELEKEASRRQGRREAEEQQRLDNAGGTP